MTTVSLDGIREDDLARRRRLFEEYAGSWNMPDEIFPDGNVMKFIKNIRIENWINKNLQNNPRTEKIFLSAGIIILYRVPGGDKRSLR